MGVAAQSIADLVLGTLNKLGRMKFTSLAERLTEYEFLPRFIKKKRLKIEDDGIGFEFTVVTDHSNQARNVKLYDEDIVNIVDTNKRGFVPWRHTTTNWSFERRETLMNRGESKITDIITTRRFASLVSLAECMEADGWSKPVDSTDDVTPFGMFYWIVPRASGNNSAGFDGGNPAGFSGGAGNIDSTIYTRWRNWAATYTDVSKPDLITKMRQAANRTKFKSPIDHSDYSTGAGESFRIYVNETTLRAMEDLGEQQNENLGRDIASVDGTLMFRKNAIIYIPKLDEATVPANPVLMTNWNYFELKALRGDVLRESDKTEAPNQHNVATIHLDHTWNTCCTNRRRQVLLHNIY